MDNKNTGFKITIVLLSLLVIALTSYIVYDNVLPNNGDEDTNENNGEDMSEDNGNNLYNFADDVILSTLANISYSSIGFPDENGDFSQWKVLKDEGNYITLFYTGDELLSGKDDIEETINKYNERKILFTSNGIDFGNDGEIRILNKNDLLLLGCDFETLTCSNSPDWINGWTSYTKGNYKYTLSNSKLNPIEKNTYVAALARPVIKILKSNIK